MFGEKENYKYLGMLQADTFKQVGMKEKKLEKNTSKEPQNFSKPRSAPEIFSKGAQSAGGGVL